MMVLSYHISYTSFGTCRRLDLRNLKHFKRQTRKLISTDLTDEPSPPMALSATSPPERFINEVTIVPDQDSGPIPRLMSWLEPHSSELRLMSPDAATKILRFNLDHSLRNLLTEIDTVLRRVFHADHMSTSLNEDCIQPSSGCQHN